MHARDELLDLKNENEMLHETIKEMRDGLAGMQPMLVDLFGPRQRRRPEVLIALQMLATFAGLPARCDRRECRRDGACNAQDPCEPACGAGWTDELIGRFSDMVAGISLSALCAEREALVARDALSQRLGNAAKPAKRRRKVSGRAARAEPRPRA